MENKKSLLKLSSIPITDKLNLRIPTVGEILDDERNYYNLSYALTATPFQYMVQLDDMGLDFTKMSDYELFTILFSIYTKSQDVDLSILFGDIDLSDCNVYQEKNKGIVLYSPKNDLLIDELVYYDLAKTIREINLYERDKSKVGNDTAKEYLLKRKRKEQKKNANKPYKSYLEKLVIALVNEVGFPYDYDSCMDLSIYRFNQSLKQIQHKITFDNTMIGVYTGTVDTSKMKNKDEVLSWISNK